MGKTLKETIEKHQENVYECTRKLRNYVHTLTTLCENYNNTDSNYSDLDLAETVSDIAELCFSTQIEMIVDYVQELLEKIENVKLFETV